MKKFSIFAVLSFTNRAVVLSAIVGIFLCLQILYGVPTPCLHCNGVGSGPIGDLAAGSGAPFLFSALQKLNSFSTMLSRNESSSVGSITPDRNRLANERGLKVFCFNHDTNVEVVMINEIPHFVVIDVCRALGLSNVTESLRQIDDDEKLTSVVLRSGQKRTVNLVNESGLYALIFQSRKPVAKKFRKWVTSEVLPSIRKTGSYSGGTDIDIDFLKDMLSRTNAACMREIDAYSRENGINIDRDSSYLSRGYTWAEDRSDNDNLKGMMITFHNGLMDGLDLLLHSIGDQRSIQADPLTACEHAIKNYRFARVNMRDAAQGVVNYTM